MGAPSIDGGMTKAEQEELLADERRYQEEQEASRKATARMDEKLREEADKSERERIKAEELARITEADIAEQESIEASTSMQDAETNDNDKIKVDFYSSLYSGAGDRPTTRTNTQRPK